MDVYNSYQHLHDWFQTFAGQRLETEIMECLQHRELTGFNQSLLQIGDIGQNQWLSDLKFKNHWVYSPYPSSYANLIGFPTELPFANHSMDVLFAPFIFEMGLEIRPLINELDRVLESMGYLIIIGFNPLGLWKCSKYFARPSKRLWYQAYRGASFWSVKSMLMSLGYAQIDAQFFYYIPPVSNPTLINYFNVINRFAKLIAPYPPSFFMLVMQKRDADFTLVGLEKTPLW